MQNKRRFSPKIRRKTNEIIEVWQGKNEQIVTDPAGSYTGTPLDGSTPIQDADDL